MKKLIPVAAFAVVALLFTSCKKDYTCTCTITPTGGGANTTVAIPITKSSKSDAKSTCDAAKTTYSNVGTASCSL